MWIVFVVFFQNIGPDRSGEVRMGAEQSPHGSRPLFGVEMHPNTTPALSVEVRVWWKKWKTGGYRHRN